MIRKHFILLVFIALEALPSCKTTNFVGRVIQSKKAHENSQIDYYFERGDSVPFDFRSGKILFEAEINGQKDTVMFDTGCTTSILEMVSETDCPDIKFF